jgi:glycosyltransferase involved in cell wall biosynthesis
MVQGKITNSCYYLQICASRGISIFGFMKVLQLCNKVPYPEKDGGAIGINVFSREFLRAGHKVKMLAMNTTKHFVDIQSIPAEFRNGIGLETVTVDNSVKPAKALMALLKGESYNISRFYSKEYEEKLEAILNKETYDVVQVEGLYVASYIPNIRKLSKAPIIMRAHNVEWKIWERLADEEKNPLKKSYLKILRRQLRKYEENAVNLCDGITTTTVNDMNLLKVMGCKTPIAHIPFGINVSRYSPVQSPEPNTLLYIGALDWLPNLQALEWFLKEVWNKVNSVLPDVKLHIAGRNMPENIKAGEYSNVIFHGEVENALTFMNTYNIMLSPLLAGSGVRVKIIEGMALGKPIVTSTVGIEGIECNYGKDVMVADTPDEFCNAIKQLIQNPNFTRHLSANARTFALTNHDIQKIVEKLVAFYSERIKAK